MRSTIYFRATSLDGCMPVPQYLSSLRDVEREGSLGNLTALLVMATVANVYSRNVEFAIGELTYEVVDKSGLAANATFPIVVWHQGDNSRLVRILGYSIGALVAFLLFFACEYTRRKRARGALQLLLRRTGAPPKLSLPSGQRYHIFLSHT